MTSTEDDVAELERLRAVQAEYSVTVRVLAVVLELLLIEVGDPLASIEITDEALECSPQLRAWRVPERSSVAVGVIREEAD